MAESRGDDEIFVYMGGDQRVPHGVRRAKIHKSVKIVRKRAFRGLHQLISVEFHDGVEIIEEQAFYRCPLRGPIILLGVKIIKKEAFSCCYHLTDVEFGDKLETIEQHAFYKTGLRLANNITLPSVRTVGESAFAGCVELYDVEFDKDLRTIQRQAFHYCRNLKRITLPLKGNMIEDDVFYQCPKLETVDLVVGVHQTIASLHLESWRNEMNDEINRINQTLPTTTRGKTHEIRQWMGTVIQRLDHYKAEHRTLLKEATTLLELALWKANLDGNGGGGLANEGVRITRGSRKRARKEICVTSGSDVVIKNVLPFLQLSE